jgi:hypothetical protein
MTAGVPSWQPNRWEMSLRDIAKRLVITTGATRSGCPNRRLTR